MTCPAGPPFLGKDVDALGQELRKQELDTHNHHPMKLAAHIYVWNIILQLMGLFDALYFYVVFLLNY